MGSGGGEGQSAARLKGLVDLFERLRERPSHLWWRRSAVTQHEGVGARERDLLRPLLLILGPASVPGGPATGTQLAAEQFAERCKRNSQPYSDVSALTDADLPTMLREVKRELANGHPRGEPAIRFPLLDMALWLRELREIRFAPDRPMPAHPSRDERENRQLTAELAAAGGDDRRRQALNRVIRQRGQHVLRDRREEEERGRFATFLGYLEQIAPIGVAVVALVSATAASALDLVAAMFAAGLGMAFVAVEILARTRGWYGLRRYRWFTRQPYLRGDAPGFLGFALNVVDPRGRRQPADVDEQLDLLVVAALLEDLRRAYRRTYWRATWARVCYPVVIFEQIRPDHAGRTFIRLVERIRADAVLDPERPKADPLVITAGLDPEAHPELIEEFGGSARIVDPARETAREIARAERAGPEADPETEPEADPEAEPEADPEAEPESDSEAEPEADPEESPEEAGAQAPVPDAVALDDAAGSWREHLAEQRRVAVLGTRRRIVVDAMKDEGGPIEEPRPPRRRPWLAHPALPWLVMFVVLAASSAVIVMQSVRYCDPRTVWHAADGQCVGITDGSYVYSPRIASVEAKIRKLNREVMASGKPYITIVYLGAMTSDPRNKSPQGDLLSGTHGELLGMSIAQQRHNEAAGQPGLRILLANAGARFAYAEPVAERIRERAAQDPTLVAVIGFGQSRRQTQEAIDALSKAALPMIGTTNTFDGTGLLRGSYSPYYFRLAPSNHELALHAAYWAKSGALHVRARTADVFYDAVKDDLYSGNLANDFREAFGASSVRMLPYTDPTQVPAKVQQACLHPADVFYYAGRSDEFRSFINMVSNTSCGTGARIVLAGDEVTKYVSDNAAEIARNDSIRLYFTPLAAREAWDPQWVGGQPVPVFYSDFQQVVDGLAAAKVPANAWPSRTHAALGYDGAQAIIYVAQRIYGDQGKTLPTVAAILSSLTEPDTGAAQQGASGLLRFGGRAMGHAVPEKPVLLVTVPSGGTSGEKVLAVCGRLVEVGGRQSTDCPTAKLSAP